MRSEQLPCTPADAAQEKRSPMLDTAMPNNNAPSFHSLFKGSGMLDATKSTLRKQLLGKLHQARGNTLQGPKPSSMQEQVMNTVFAEYLGACQRTNTLSVFLAEASLCDSVHLTHDDILTSLRIQPSSQLYKRIISALAEDKENGTIPRCFAQALLQSLSTAISCTTVEAGTNTDEDPVGQAATQLALLDHRFDAHGAAQTAPAILSQKLADLQNQCDQRVALQVSAQVEVIREIELGQAREEEASRWRHELAQQRGELERLYTERMKHVRELEDAAVSRAHELQRAAEHASFDMRQRMVAEDDRMRATLLVADGGHKCPGLFAHVSEWDLTADEDEFCTELQIRTTCSSVQDRERDLCARVAVLEAREASITVREKHCVETQEECRRRCSEAHAQLDTAKDEARKQAEAELDKQRAELCSKRTAFEQERARIMALHDESSNAVARLAERDSRIEALLVSRADAEARANVKASELHSLQSHSCRIQHELELLHQELFGGAAGRVLENVSRGALASAPQVVGGSAEGLVHLRHEVHKLTQSARLADSRTCELQERLDHSQKELAAAKAAASSAKAEVEALRESVLGAQALLRDAEGSLERVHTQADDYRLALKHANTELRALEDALAAAKAARDDAIATACISTIRASPCASLGADIQHVAQTAMQACPSAECAALAPESSYGAACGMSMGSSVALISQRLELLEMEEAELQEEYGAFRRKLVQQQAALQQCLPAGAGDPPRDHVPLQALAHKGKGAVMDFASHRSMNSMHQSPIHAARAHVSGMLQAIPAVYTMAVIGAGACDMHPNDALQATTSSDSKDGVGRASASCPSESHASTSHALQCPEAQCTSSTLPGASSTVSSQGRRSITIDHQDAVEALVPTEAQPVEHVGAVQPCMFAECDCAAANPQPEPVHVLDETTFVAPSQPASQPASTGSAGTHSVCMKDVASVLKTSGVVVCEDSEAEAEASIITSEVGTSGSPDHNGLTEHDSDENAGDAATLSSSSSRKCESPHSEHAEEFVESVQQKEKSIRELEEELEQQQSEESIRLQILGTYTHVHNTPPTLSSEAESSYSFEGDDVELEGIDFGGVGMELLEET